MTASAVSCGAILLAGGRATRLGGTTKPLLEVGGRTLLQRAVDAVQDAGARPITVASDVLDPGLAVEWVREDPPFGGPAAAVVAVLEAWVASDVDPEWTFLLACDLPRADWAIAQLSTDLTLLPADTDGLCLADPSGRPQWLTGLYRTRALRDAASALPDRGRDAPVRALVADLSIAVVRAPAEVTADVDTWEDLYQARRGGIMSEHLPPEALDVWVEALRERFGLGADDVPISLVLDLAKDVANGVARPAAPVSAFVAGLVAGRAGGSPDQSRQAADVISQLASEWTA